MAVDRNARKTKVGIVVSDKMDKTIVVAINNFVISGHSFQSLMAG